MSTTTRRRLLGVLGALASAALLAGCATPAQGSAAGSSAPAASSDTLSGTVAVYAAASLKQSFDDLTARFHKAHPGVVFSPVDYDGSSTLATQIDAGAPADVFASADQRTMKQVVDAGMVSGSATPFVSNTLEIVVAPGNPKHITSLADLSRSGMLVDLCATEVPCGAASEKLLAAQKVTVKAASREQNVTAVLTKVRLGEADAGLVYRTDVESAGSAVAGVTIPDASVATNIYPIAVLKDAQSPGAAKAFVDYVTSAAGRKVLAGYGFSAP